uniref:Uncharacterized protein n=1 Tax=Drosophila-associated salivary gland hypertrophy virus TaxID=2853730 RepID=A0A8F4RRF6_9VIRU|nr:hypothetical protein [Drosophila-associated salivary gland hypertrophy virus]
MTQRSSQQQINQFIELAANQNQGVSRGGGTGLNVNIDTTQQPQPSGGEESRFDTLLNSIFSSATQKECTQQLPMNVCSHKELPCFFEFLSTCSPRREEDLVYGLYCLRHTNATNRTFAAMGTQTTVDMQPIYLKTAVCERNMFLWSFLTNLTYARAKELISFMNISTSESSNMAKFIMTVSEPFGQRQNSEEYQRLSQYLSAYCQNAIKCLESIPDRDKILIPIIFTDQFIVENAQNRLVWDILDKAKKEKLSVQTVNSTSIQVFVPLTMLNILDQINLLSFRMYCGIGRVSLAPNVSITGERIYIGSGLSIRNALSSVDITKLRSFYPDNIYRLIRSVHGDNVHNNYDILVLLAVPQNVSVAINPQIFIAKRKYLISTFDIDKLDVLTIC